MIFFDDRSDDRIMRQDVKTCQRSLGSDLRNSVHLLEFKSSSLHIAAPLSNPGSFLESNPNINQN